MNKNTSLFAGFLLLLCSVSVMADTIKLGSIIRNPDVIRTWACSKDWPPSWPWTKSISRVEFWVETLSLSSATPQDLRSVEPLTPGS